MRLFLLLSLVLFLFPPFPAFAIELNYPLNAAKVGVWVERQISSISGGKTTTQIEKTIVTNRDSKSITLKTEMAGKFVEIPLGKQRVKKEISGKGFFSHLKFPSRERTFSHKMFQRSVLRSEKKGSGFEILGEGNESISVSGKKFKCHWVKSRVVVSQGGKPLTITSTEWSCSDFPIFPVVKRVKEYKGAMDLITIEQAVNFGTK